MGETDMSPALAESLDVLASQEITAKDTGTTFSNKGTMTGQKEYKYSWLHDALNEINKLINLPQNWDSYGAIPISGDNAIAAIDLLMTVMKDETPRPAFIPTNQGSVQLEWHTGGIDLEIEILSPHRFFLSFENSNTGETIEKEITVMNISPIIDCLDALIGH